MKKQKRRRRRRRRQKKKKTQNINTHTHTQMINVFKFNSWFYEIVHFSFNLLNCLKLIYYCYYRVVSSTREIRAGTTIPLPLRVQRHLRKLKELKANCDFAAPHKSRSRQAQLSSAQLTLALKRHLQKAFDTLDALNIALGILKFRFSSGWLYKECLHDWSGSIAIEPVGLSGYSSV